MYLIAGLGNPGSKYEYTRHNAGFLVIDDLAKKLNIKVNKLKFKSLIGEGFIGSEKVILMKPSTYMNDSGKAILDCFNYYNLTSDNLIVICDDIDIPFGTIRIKKKGSAGTHNGLKSIIYLIQSQDFCRIKVSVGQNENYDLKDFVLSQFSKKEFEVLEKEIEMSSEAAIKIIENNVDFAMNNYNGKSVLWIFWPKFMKTTGNFKDI